MLVRFGVENFKSIQSYQELLFTTAPIREAGLTFGSDVLGESLLPVIALYGANASGKSNMLEALEYMVNLILTSQTDHRPDTPFSYRKFLLDEHSSREPTKFECEFVIDGMHFQYGFELGQKEVHSEWLFAHPKVKRKSRQIWFHRDSEETEKYHFGPYLKGSNRTIESLTRDDSLFLSAAAQNNHPQLSPIFQYFAQQISFGVPKEFADDFMVSYLKDRDVRQVVKLLKAADLGIEDLKLHHRKVEHPEDELFTKIGNLIKEEAGEEASDIYFHGMGEEISFYHRSKTLGRPVPLNSHDESKGTLIYLSLIVPVLDCLEKGGMLIVDELDASLHPLLVGELVKLFLNPQTNKNGAQLLFTTHDIGLYRMGKLRRDQIWYAEKDENGSTTIFPLSDLKIRRGDNIEKGYMEGRFGAVPRPYFGELEIDHKEKQETFFFEQE